MLNILAVLIYLGIAVLVYRTVLKDREQGSLTKKSYVGTLLSGALPCTICIIIFELLFDRFVLDSSGAVLEEIFVSFARAALIEEAFKYLFCRRAIKKLQPASKVETMLLCGMIGAGYGLVEKIALGGGVILIVNAFLPLHIFFQFLMGALLYDGRKGAAFLLPFLVHGLWDSMLSVAGWLLDFDSGLVASAGVLLIAALVAIGIIAEIKVVRKMKQMA